MEMKCFSSRDDLEGFIDSVIGDLPGEKEWRQPVVIALADDIIQMARDCRSPWGSDWSAHIDDLFSDGLGEALSAAIEFVQERAKRKAAESCS